MISMYDKIYIHKYLFCPYEMQSPVLGTVGNTNEREYGPDLLAGSNLGKTRGTQRD